jgi:cytochrome c-type biogenesis protein CcmH
MMRRATRAARRALIASFAVLLVAGALSAQATAPTGAELDRLTKETASQLRCPVCQGESIEASPSELAVELKGVVREQLASGKTSEEVKAYFVERYGEWILLQPRATGFNWVVYLLPPVLLLAGGAALYALLKKWTRPTTADQAAS